MGINQGPAPVISRVMAEVSLLRQLHSYATDLICKIHFKRNIIDFQNIFSGNIFQVKQSSPKLPHSGCREMVEVGAQGPGLGVLCG